jgi:putative phosphoesterase
MRIALLSDTHVPTLLPELPSQLLEQLAGVDLILHAGDLVSIEVLESLQSVADTVAVQGNVDHHEVVRLLPRRQLLSVVGRRLGLMHGNQAPRIERQYLHPGGSYDSPAMETFYEYLAHQLPDAEIIVFGHVHVPYVKHWNDRLLVNPGAVAPYRGHSSFGLLDLDVDRVRPQIIEL